MKKIVVTIILTLTISIGFGQNKAAEKMTIANTKEMVKALSLESDLESKIYDINLEKNTALLANKAKEQSEEEMTINRKGIYKTAQHKFREVLGKDKLKEWNAYKKAQSASKKNK